MIGNIITSQLPSKFQDHDLLAWQLTLATAEIQFFFGLQMKGRPLAQ